MLNRIRTHWTLLALLLLVGLQLWVGVLWIWTDEMVGQGVCCNFTSPIMEILLADGTNQLGWPWSTYRQSMGLLVWPALWARKLVGPDTDFLLWLNLITAVCTQVLLYDIGRRLSGRVAGLVAAGLFPMVPAIAYIHRRWDAMAPQQLVLVAALWMLVMSRNLTRVIPTLGFVLVAMIGCVLSARETDNLLFMAAVGAMTVGPVARGLITGAGPTAGKPPGRLATCVGAVTVAGVMAVFCWKYAFPLVDFAYFGDEFGNLDYEQRTSKWSFTALMAYPIRLYSDDLTPWFALPLLAALGPFCRRSPARAEILSWLILPLLALSLIGKKNFYYAAIIYPVVPLILGLGLGQISRVWVRNGAAVLLLCISWIQFSARSMPATVWPEALTEVNWNGSMGPQEHLFQGVVPLNLGPSGPSSISRLTGMVAPEVIGSSCDCPQQLVVHGQGDFAEIQLSLKMIDPCLNMANAGQVDHPPSVNWVLSARSRCGDDTAPGSAEIPTRKIREIRIDNGCAQLWERTSERLCGHAGSPPD